MIDIKIFRETPEKIKESQKKRREDINLVDNVVLYDKRWRHSLTKVQKLKYLRNKVGNEIAVLKRKKKDALSKIKEMKKISDEINSLDTNIRQLQKQRDDTRLKIKNVLHTSVPLGKDDTENVPVRHYGKKPKFKFKPKSHVDLLYSLDLADMEKAADAAGARFFYLKNEAALLSLAIMKFGFDFMVKEGFTPIIPPMLIKEKTLEQAGFLPFGRDQVYFIKDKPLCLTGTSEQALSALHMGDTLEEKELPKKYTGFSSCFRTEAGSHGRDTKGLFRTHQFNKIEQFVFCKPEDSWKWLEKMTKMTEKLFKKLKLPYRIVTLCSGDTGTPQSKTYDLEVWMPVQKAYREVGSTSNCTNYQAVRLKTRYRKPDGTTEYVHTLNNTVIVDNRIIVAILENLQQKDGSVKIPRALYKYLPGIKKIEKK